MKKTMILAAFAALLSLVSCQKEELNGTVKNGPSAAPATESPVFTATIEDGSKTTLNAELGKVSWEDTDEITVTDKDKKSAVYSIASIDYSTGRATFEYKSGDELGAGPYSATYGTAPATAQTYSDSSVNLYMTAESSTTSLTFTVQCGLMEINLTKADEYVKSIAVTGTPAGGSEITTYTLTCTEPQSIAAESTFYISVAAGIYNKIVITDSEDKVCTLTAASGITVEANHIKPLTFVGSKLNFIPAGALTGVFSVSNDDGTTITKVFFSYGNLWYGKAESATTATWNFEANQYDSNSSWSTTHVSHFYWGPIPAITYQSNSPKTSGMKTTDVFFTNASKTKPNANFKVNVGGKEQSDWRTLSTEEWQYLFNTRTMTNDKARYSDARSGVTIGGSTYKGVFLYPDNYNGKEVVDNTETWTWDKINSAGIVFLPSAGSRSKSNVSNVGSTGIYWSSSAHTSTAASAYCVRFNSTSLSPGTPNSRAQGCSVRLVTEAK